MNSIDPQLSDRRLAPVGANAANSTRPPNSEQKEKSQPKAINHRLCATTFVVDNEDQDELQRMREQYDGRFGPRDLAESDLVDRMVRATWKLRRASNMENELLNVQMLRMEAELNRTFIGMPERTRLMAAFSELAKQPALALLHRYANNLSAEYQRAFKALRELQKDVPIAPPGSPSETNQTADGEPEPAAQCASETNPTAEAAGRAESTLEFASETNPTTPSCRVPQPASESASGTNPTAAKASEAETALEPACETNVTAKSATESEPASDSASETKPTGNPTVDAVGHTGTASDSGGATTAISAPHEPDSFFDDLSDLDLLLSRGILIVTGA